VPIEKKVDSRRKPPDGKNYKKYKAFKITTKVIEHRDHPE